MSTSEFVIDTSELGKSYNGVQALKSLDLKVPKTRYSVSWGQTEPGRQLPSNYCWDLHAPHLAVAQFSGKTSLNTA